MTTGSGDNSAHFPSRTVIGLKPDGKARWLAQLPWGFVPYWANNPNAGPKPINAKAEPAA